MRSSDISTSNNLNRIFLTSTLQISRHLHSMQIQARLHRIQTKAANLVDGCHKNWRNVDEGTKIWKTKGKHRWKNFLSWLLG